MQEELKEGADLLQLLASAQVSSEQLDKWHRVHDLKGVCLLGEILLQILRWLERAPFNQTSGRYLEPLKVETPLQLAALGRSSTRDFLFQRGIVTAAANFCPFCIVEQEKVPQRLLGC